MSVVKAIRLAVAGLVTAGGILATTPAAAQLRGPNGRGATVTHDGTTATGTFGQSGGRTTATGGYGNGKESGAGAVVIDGGRSAAGWSQTDSKGNSMTGFVSGHAGAVQQRDANGASRGGSYQTGPNWQVGGHDFDPAGNGNAGSVGRDGRAIVFDGEHRQLGYIPGTQERYGVGGRIDGRDTAVKPRFEVYDATGTQRLGGSNGTVDRTHATQTQGGGVGPVQATQTDTVRFAGPNSTVTRTGGVNLGGLGSSQQTLGADRNGVTFDQKMTQPGIGVGVGGHVGPNGISVRPPVFTPPPLPVFAPPPVHLPPPIHVPQPPRVSVPTVSVPQPPRVTPPPVRLPDPPRVSVPSIPQPSVSLGGRKIKL